MEGGSGPVLHPLIHTLLDFNMAQDIAIYHSKHSFGFLVCVPMSLASFG